MSRNSQILFLRYSQTKPTISCICYFPPIFFCPPLPHSYPPPPKENVDAGTATAFGFEKCLIYYNIFTERRRNATWALFLKK